MSALETRRARIREALPNAIKTATDLAGAAASRLDAPDPESGLVYLWQLHQVFEKSLADLDPCGFARRIARRTA